MRLAHAVRGALVGVLALVLLGGTGAGVARAEDEPARRPRPPVREAPPGAPGQRGGPRPSPPGAGPIPPEVGARAGDITGAPLAPGEEQLHPGYSPYESDTMRRALVRLGAELDPAPEGKLVEAVEVLPLEVIEDRDPAPEILNLLHVTTHPYVIRREVLLAVGRPYQQALADETARHLRTISQISLVLVFPVRGSRPDRVRVVVVTKDVWSLRLNSNYRFAGGKLEYLLIQPSEQNLFGTHHAVASQMILEPASVAFGLAYTLPRVGGSRIVLNTDMNLILGRETGDLEGSFGSFTYGQPLYATEATWSWGAELAWRNEISRRYVAGAIAAYDVEATPEEERIPYLYRSDLVSGSYTLTRSFGRAVKHDFSLGLESSRRKYRPRPLDLAGLTPEVAGAFVREALPVSDTRVGPSVEYHTYSTDFTRVLDFNTLALQEDYRVGHDLSVKVYPVLRAVGSTRDFLGVAANAAYTVPLGDGLARAVVETVTELEQSRVPDASLDLSGRIHTPRFGVGRLVFDAHLLRRYRNYLNRRSQLGGETRLRGYATGELIGDDVLSANLELRSLPLEVWSVQIAGAAFYDVGDAFDGWDELRVKQSAGFGLRVLFPQLSRTVMRADWGFPLTRGYVERDSFPGDILITFQQAFLMPSPSTAPF